MGEGVRFDAPALWSRSPTTDRLPVDGVFSFWDEPKLSAEVPNIRPKFERWAFCQNGPT